MKALGLRGQLVTALLLVTVGAIASVGAIAVWQVREALTRERFERASRLCASLRLLAERAIDPARPLRDPANRAILAALGPDLARAVGADELAFFDEEGAPLAATVTPPLPSDARGVAAALAGVPPHAEPLSGAPQAGGHKLVAYAAIAGSGRPRGALRATFPLDDAVDATLGRAKTTLVVLGAVDGLVLLLAAAWIVRGAVVRPVRALEQAAGRVAAGDLDARIETRGPGELGRLADAFERMTESLRVGRETLLRTEKLAGVGRLAAGVAHEVGNPLAAILGYVEMLLDDRPDKPIDPVLRRDLLERVRHETVRIHKIIQELLEYSRPPRDEVGPVDVGKVVEAALSLARASGRARDVAAELRIPAELPPVRATSGRLTQVLLNLLLNAADATGGTGRIVVEAHRRGEDRVVIAVEDDGPGVPAELRDRIFDPFFTTKEPGHGTGLGLAVSSSLVETFGGELRLVPSQRGARFEIELPIAQ